MAINKVAPILGLWSVTACSAKPEQGSVVLRLVSGRESSLEKITAAAAMQLQMRSTSQTFDFGGTAGKLRAYMLSGRGIVGVSIFHRRTKENA
jgi:hypothetical protein